MQLTATHFNARCGLCHSMRAFGASTHSTRAFGASRRHYAHHQKSTHLNTLCTLCHSTRTFGASRRYAHHQKSTHLGTNNKGMCRDISKLVWESINWGQNPVVSLPQLPTSPCVAGHQQQRHVSRYIQNSAWKAFWNPAGVNPVHWKGWFPSLCWSTIVYGFQSCVDLL